jgi:hypothetical protein
MLTNIEQFFQIDGCVQQNTANRNLSVQADRIAFYTNATNCILARARCGSYNPITGELQVPQLNSLTNYVATTSNSLQISASGDLRIISFPANIKVAEIFCSSRVTLDQPGYGDAVC